MMTICFVRMELNMNEKIGTLTFPDYTGLRCLMMPYIQGDPTSVPEEYRSYFDILISFYFEKDQIGFLTIDESIAFKDTPHRGDRAKYGRALHTEAGLCKKTNTYKWGGPTWGGSPTVRLDSNTQILLANSIDNSCAIWDAEHTETSEDGDIGYESEMYPYSKATFLQANSIHQIGIFTPHESVPVTDTTHRQFIRILSSGVHGRESYFTKNPLMNEN